MDFSSPQSRPEVAPEEQARADMYALLGRLYADAPDASLLAAIARAPAFEIESERGRELALAWRALTLACSAMDEEAARQEYVDLFIGVGKSEVNLHASYYLAGFMMEKPLADIRVALAGLGLGRQAGARLVEDHLAALFEAMRLLIGGGVGLSPQSVAVQKKFFNQYVAPWCRQCCNAINQSPIAKLYRLVAQLTAVFLGLEAEAFSIE